MSHSHSTLFFLLTIYFLLYLKKNYIFSLYFSVTFVLFAFTLIWNVTPTLNVSRKFSMCIIFSTGYIKIYNLNTSNEYHIQQFTFVHLKIQHILSNIYKITLKSMWTSCSGYERVLAVYPFGCKLAKSC